MAIILCCLLCAVSDHLQIMYVIPAFSGRQIQLAAAAAQLPVQCTGTVLCPFSVGGRQICGAALTPRTNSALVPSALTPRTNSTLTPRTNSTHSFIDQWPVQ